MTEQEIKAEAEKLITDIQCQLPQDGETNHYKYSSFELAKYLSELYITNTIEEYNNFVLACCYDYDIRTYENRIKELEAIKSAIQNS